MQKIDAAVADARTFTGTVSRMSVLTGPGGNGVIVEPQLLKYEAGTIIIIPPGIPHNATHEVTERTNFIIYRIVPTRVRFMKEWALTYREVPFRQLQGE